MIAERRGAGVCPSTSMSKQSIISSLVEGFLNPEVYLLAPDATARATVAVTECLTDAGCCCASCKGDEVCREMLTTIVTEAVVFSPLVESDLHGWMHWLSVYRNAVVIAEVAKLHTFGALDEEMSPDLDLTAVAILFALFHDCRRHDEGPDETHGAFGAAALLSLVTRGVLPLLTEEVEAAAFACMAHTIVQNPSGDPAWKAMPDDVQRAAGMCLDADRLDLIRLGITPNPYFLTHGAKTLSSFEKLWHNGAWKS